MWAVIGVQLHEIGLIVVVRSEIRDTRKKWERAAVIERCKKTINISRQISLIRSRRRRQVLAFGSPSEICKSRCPRRELNTECCVIRTPSKIGGEKQAL